MARIAALAELDAVPCRVVVINVATDLVTTRAVLSGLDVAKVPVLLVNCDPTAESSAHFDRLMQGRALDVIDGPLMLHGQTLDWLAEGLGDERLLLLDSDAELRDADFVAWMHRMLDHPRCFGAGFLEGPNRIAEHWFAPVGEVLYMERPWLPCTLLRMADVRAGIAAGHTFVPRFTYNEVPALDRVNRFLAARWGHPWGATSYSFERLPGMVRRWMTKRRFDLLRFARRRYYYARRPHMVFYDTGADIYEHLKFERELLFAGQPAVLMEGQVHHYGGVSRWAMVGEMVDDTSPAAIEHEVVDRLREAYGYVWGD